MSGPAILLCSCGGTMPNSILARAGNADLVHRELCRVDFDRARDAMAQGRPVVLACGQEIPLFEELRSEVAADLPVSYVNLRETALWSDEADDALPKVKALIAAASRPVPPAATVPLSSQGRVLVIGKSEAVVAATAMLADKFSITALLTDGDDFLPPPLTKFPIYRGRLRRLVGHLGSYVATVDDCAAMLPSGRVRPLFGVTEDGIRLEADVIVDLEDGSSALPARREGYLRPQRGSPDALAVVFAQLPGLVGEFSKPRSIDLTTAACAHRRSLIEGCRLCLDVCPSGAVTSAAGKDHVDIDPYVCIGCGSCAGACPTGAARYAFPPAEHLFDKLRTLLAAYADAGGNSPQILIHDAEAAVAIIAALARYGRGLPARVLPFALPAATVPGLDFLLAALAWGADRIVILLPPNRSDEIRGITRQADVAATLLDGMGHGRDRIAILQTADPHALDQALWSPRLSRPTPLPVGLHGSKRTIILNALQALSFAATPRSGEIALPSFAGFGAVTIERDRCTLCAACVGACPTRALLASPDRPCLSFVEALCIQCGLCARTCPEKAMSLVPRFVLPAPSNAPIELKEEEPFYCTRCGKPFGTKSGVARVAAKLAAVGGRFSSSAEVVRLEMCADCRVIDRFEREIEPLAGPHRPVPRSTDDVEP